LKNLNGDIIMDNKKLEKLFKGLKNNNIPADIKIRMHGHLANFRKKTENLKPGFKINFENTFPNLIFASKIRLAVAFGFIGIIFLALTYTIFLHDSNNVYAAVTKQLQNVRILQHTSKFADRGIVIKYVYKAPGFFRVNISSQIEMILNKDTNDKIIIFHRIKKYTNDFGDNLDDMEMLLKSYYYLTELPQQADEKLGHRLIEEKSVEGFRVNEENHRVDVWINTRKKKLEFVYTDFFRDKNIIRYLEIRDIKINQTIDPSLLQIIIPKGYEKLDKFDDILWWEELNAL